MRLELAFPKGYPGSIPGLGVNHFGIFDGTREKSLEDAKRAWTWFGRETFCPV